MSPALLSIKPSQKNNKIVFDNIYILNCLSLKNQIIDVQFSQDKSSQNFFFIKNIQIIQTEQAWKQYFQKTGQLSYSIIDNIINDNALINLESCTLVIKNLVVQGIVISSILKIQNVIKLQITNCKFISVESFGSFNLIEIIQNNENLMDVKMNDNEFKNIKLYQPKFEQIQEKLGLNDFNFESNCQTDKYNLIFEKIRFSFQQIIQLIQNSETSSGSLVFKIVTSKQKILKFSKIMLINVEEYC